MSLLNAGLNIVRAGFRLIRPVTPQLVPLIICLGVIPLLIFSSLLSGWTIWNSVPTGWQAPVYLQYGDGLPPYAELSLPKLIYNQPYDISLHISVPATEANYALGNFMTTLTISSTNNKTLMVIRRPSLVSPPSSRVPSVISRPQRLIDLHVPLLLSFVPGTTQVLARIEVGRRDGWRSLGMGEGRELTVFSAVIRGNVRPHGILGILSRFPITLTIISTITFFILSLLAVIACLVPAIQWHFARASSDETGNSTTSRRRLPASGDTSVGRLSGRPSMGAPGPTRRRNSDSDTGLPRVAKLPSPSPEAEPPMIPIRRRLRRLADDSSSDYSDT